MVADPRTPASARSPPFRPHGSGLLLLFPLGTLYLAPTGLQGPHSCALIQPREADTSEHIYLGCDAGAWAAAPWGHVSQTVLGPFDSPGQGRTLSCVGPSPAYLSLYRSTPPGPTTPRTSGPFKPLPASLFIPPSSVSPFKGIVETSPASGAHSG